MKGLSRVSRETVLILSENRQNKTLYHVQKYVIVSRDGSLLEIERGAGLRLHDVLHHVQSWRRCFKWGKLIADICRIEDNVI